MIQLLVDKLETDCIENCSIWGRICFKIDDVFFPDAMWNDIVSSVLEMWGNALYEFIRFQKAECELCFMDGDYKAVLTKAEGGRAAVSFQANDAVVMKYHTEISMFVENVLSCTEPVLAICKSSASSFVGIKRYKRLGKACRRLKKLIHR